MARMKTQVWAVLVASSLLSSMVGIGAAEREPAASTPPPAPLLRDAINHAAVALAVESSRAPQLATNRRDGSTQDPVPSVRARPVRSGGFPSWLKYTLIGAAAAGGGYAVSQIGHHDHGGRGPMDNDPMRR